MHNNCCSIRIAIHSGHACGSNYPSYSISTFNHHYSPNMQLLHWNRNIHPFGLCRSQYLYCDCNYQWKCFHRVYRYSYWFSNWIDPYGGHIDWGTKYFWKQPHWFSSHSDWLSSYWNRSYPYNCHDHLLSAKEMWDAHFWRYHLCDNHYYWKSRDHLHHDLSFAFAVCSRFSRSRIQCRSLSRCKFSSTFRNIWFWNHRYGIRFCSFNCS